MQALSVYPNHLKSLLLIADLLLAGGGNEAVPYLARAWRLSGALAPQHIHTIIERRKRVDILEAVRKAAHEVDLSTSITGEGVAVPTVEDRDTHRVVEESQEVTPPEPAPQPTAEEVEVPVEAVTKKDIIRLAAREVYRDGKVTPEEKAHLPPDMPSLPHRSRRNDGHRQRRTRGSGTKRRFWRRFRCQGFVSRRSQDSLSRWQGFARRSKYGHGIGQDFGSFSK